MLCAKSISWSRSNRSHCSALTAARASSAVSAEFSLP